ncbi:WD40 repeat domain-containing protein, partial [Nonomuraea sp. RK-328]|nr:WD40 repeat domain-containing protein [Nonomuraea sp. RK-328]
VRAALSAKAHTLDSCKGQNERAAYLKLAGHQHKVDVLTKQAIPYWWDCYWGEWQATSEHQVVMRGEFITKLSSVAMDDERLIVAADDTGKVRIIDPFSHFSRYEVTLDSAITALFAIKDVSAPAILAGTEAGYVWIVKAYQGGIRAFKVGRLDGVVTCLAGVIVQRGDMRVAAGTASGEFLYQRRKPGMRIEEHRVKHTASVCDVSFFGRHGNFVLVALQDGHVGVMVARTMQLDAGYGANVDEDIRRVFLVNSSPDEGQTILIATDHEIGPWNLDFGLPLEDSIPTPGDGLTLCVSEYSSQRVVIASDSNLIRVLPWDMQSEDIILRGHDEPIRDISELSFGDAHYVISSSQDATVRLWPVRLGDDSMRLGTSTKPVALGFIDANSDKVSVVLAGGRVVGDRVPGINAKTAYCITDIDYVDGYAVAVCSHRVGVYLNGSMVTGEAVRTPARLARISDTLLAISADTRILIGRYSWAGPEAWREIRSLDLDDKLIGIHACEAGPKWNQSIVARTETRAGRDVCIITTDGQIIFHSAEVGIEAFDATTITIGHTVSVVMVDETDLVSFVTEEDEDPDWTPLHITKRLRSGEALLASIRSAHSQYVLLLENGSLSIHDAATLSLLSAIDLGGGRPLCLKVSALNSTGNQWTVLVGTSAGAAAFKIDLAALGSCLQH